jgi:hypothetical protein
LSRANSAHAPIPASGTARAGPYRVPLSEVAALRLIDECDRRHPSTASGAKLNFQKFFVSFFKKESAFFFEKKKQKTFEN